ncbi:DUF58 domain-containing protein [Marinobacter sp. F3R08]|uniref:DUF58 domain-containing protein n=1 Tax=Marinobacter sp. F3R08 TaxID=2841559 RepID=UPI001C0A62BF|nr:DUF58 domain-containing protein [Marinobacter sp. F3R08]MBU2955292.1 DUF58 domain-containing protein [Marinobacter sp. F3R08]
MGNTEATTHIGLPDLIRLQADARALKLPSARPVRSRQSGLRRSPLRGRGMAFAEVRLYQPGDDIRSIDWRVTARRQEPHTKLYEEERERPVLLLCDLGPSLFFASTGAFKQVRCAQVAAILAWLALWSGDQVGGIVFNGEALSVLRPARRKKSVLRFLDTLDQQQRRDSRGPTQQDPSGKSRLDTALTEARRVAHTGSRVFVISDFLDISPDTSSLLSALARHNAVSALRIVDPLEQTLPKSGRFAVAGPEGAVWFDAGNPRFQKAWNDKVSHHEHRLKECFRTSGVTMAEVSTAEDPAIALKLLLGPGGRIG